MSRDFHAVYRLLTGGDKVVLAVLILASGASFLLAGVLTRPAAVAVVSAAGQPRFTIDLTRSRQLRLEGPAGTTVVAVEGGAIRVLDSDCPQRLCVRQGKITRVGQVIVCVPNRIIIWMRGDRRGKFDAITG